MARRALAAVIEDDGPTFEHPAIVDLTAVDWTELAGYWSAVEVDTLNRPERHAVGVYPDWRWI